MDLIVLSPFAGHREGARISDEAEVARILASEARGFVVQVESQVTDETEPQAAPAAEPQE